MAEQKQGDQLEPTYYSSVRIRGVCNPKDLPEAINDRGGEKESGISVLMAREDDDDYLI